MFSRINYTLENIQENESKAVMILLPDMEVNNFIHKTVLLLENLSELDETIVIKKEQHCDCKAVPVAVSMTRRKKVFNCKHRLMSNLYLSNEVIKVIIIR